MNTNRVKEIMDGITAFSKNEYHKSELLNEMFLLQKEMVALTFNEEHAENADLKIWDVEDHFKKLNQDCGNVADTELEMFIEESKQFCNLIKAELSGIKGEGRAFKSLERLHSENIIMKNIELCDEMNRTELDAVVITPHLITIIEVKNTAKNVFIDGSGNYYRDGEYQKYDSNLKKKTEYKEKMLRNALEQQGIYDIPIKSIVVFTDNQIEIHNTCPSLKTCFVNMLPNIIDNYDKEFDYSIIKMNEIKQIINNASNKMSYAFNFDVAKYKLHFAELMTILEEAATTENIADPIEEKEPQKKNGFWVGVKEIITSDGAKYGGIAVAGIAIGSLSTVIIEMARKGKF